MRQKRADLVINFFLVLIKLLFAETTCDEITSPPTKKRKLSISPNESVLNLSLVDTEEDLTKVDEGMLKNKTDLSKEKLVTTNHSFSVFNSNFVNFSYGSC